jgi:hypothetical protein
MKNEIILDANSYFSRQSIDILVNKDDINPTKICVIKEDSETLLFLFALLLKPMLLTKILQL